jgi:tetratricopeptide (TPR) repeat protein
MNEDTDPNPKNGSAAESPDEGLASALEVLVSNAPFRNSAQYNSAGGFTSPGAGSCPETGDWLRLASGDVPPQERQALLSHAALCTGCLARLRDSQQVLSEEITPEESAALQQFASTKPQWQRLLALQLAQTAHSSQRAGNLLRFAWLCGAVAAVLVLGLSAAFWWRQKAPEKLLAEAYTQSRTTDLRVPGADFAPVTPQAHLRGGSTDREPAPLLSARAEIERKLEQSPADAHWLQLQARAEMLEEHYDGAIDLLDRLLAAGPVTAGLLLDDGTAYYMRGTAAGSENDRATALDNLRRADELAPNDPVVLFNEAIVMEDRGQVMNAVETWNRYLKFERDPKWQDEGRKRLQSLEEKLNRVKTHESRMQEHLATPQAMRALAADPATLAGIDEEFSTTLLPQLLDAAFPLPVDRSRGSPCDEKCAAARTLLDALAASLERNHQDTWLKEFLPSDSSPIRNEYISAAHALGQAIDAKAPYTRDDRRLRQTARGRSG